MTKKMNKRMLSGVKPTGRPHIGNYFGAMRQFVELQDSFESVFVFIADYHALNTAKNPEELTNNILNLAIDYLAIGLDPQKVIFYQQSKISEHTELAWIFNTLTPMPVLERAHVYKDAKAKGKEISVGDFDYPILMSSDILIYDADVVPVGRDQKQHIEIARDTAQRFNNLYGDTFNLPEEYILESTQTIPGIDGKKMSKSYKNTIPLFSTEEEIENLSKRVVTNSDGSFPENLFTIHKLFKNEDELKPIYEKYAGQFKILKEILAEDINTFLTPLRNRRLEIEKNKSEVLDILDKGAEVAKNIASNKMVDVRKKLGVIIN